MFMYKPEYNRHPINISIKWSGSIQVNFTYLILCVSFLLLSYTFFVPLCFSYLIPLIYICWHLQLPSHQKRTILKPLHIFRHTCFSFAHLHKNRSWPCLFSCLLIWLIKRIWASRIFLKDNFPRLKEFVKSVEMTEKFNWQADKFIVIVLVTFLGELRVTTHKSIVRMHW